MSEQMQEMASQNEAGTTKITVGIWGVICLIILGVVGLYGLSAKHGAALSQHESEIGNIKKNVADNIVWIKESLERVETQQQRIDTKMDRLITGGLSDSIAGRRVPPYRSRDPTD